MLGGGGHRGGLSFGPQMVSVDRAEIPAAGWIGPGLRPCTAADVIGEDTPAGSLSVLVEALIQADAPAKAGCRLPRLRRGPRAHAQATEACTVPFRAGRDRPRLAGDPPTHQPHHNE